MSSRSPSSERKSERSMRTRSRTPEMSGEAAPRKLTQNGSPPNGDNEERDDDQQRKSPSRKSERSPSPQRKSRSPQRKAGSRSPRRSRSPRKDSGGGSRKRSRSPRKRSRSRRRSSKSPRKSRSPKSNRRRRRSSSSSGGNGARRRRSDSSSSPSYRRRRSSSRGRYSKSPSRRGGGGGGRPMMDRDNPPPSNVLGVFGLSYSTDEHDLNREFSRFGSLESIRIVRDPERRSRGFGFIDFKYMEDAKQARRALCDTYLDGKKIRVDFSLTKEPHGRTPGRYLGGGTWRSRRRSRSYSPRRY